MAAKHSLILLSLLAAPLTAHAQDYSADTKTVDSTIKSLYEVISGGKDVERDWARFRNLFAPGARMVPTVKRGDKFVTIVLTPDDYVTKAGPSLLKEGFFEKEVSRKVEEYGPIAQVFTTYESRLGSVDAKPFAKGINSVQLTFDGARWWVQNITWADEGTAGPLPERYLKGG
ncbi:MAG: hypothetical protein JSS66_00435 [Armatimonadetes bacterium]|nr:hypothetical protein [Armatimonadota bacterium]